MQTPSKTSTTSSTNKRKPYTHLACQLCKDKHLKCDGARPVCGKCLEKRAECHYRDERNRRRDLSSGGSGSSGQAEEDLQERIMKLQQEVSLWKHKYQQLKNIWHDHLQMASMDGTGKTSGTTNTNSGTGGGTTWVPYEPPYSSAPQTPSKSLSRSNSMNDHPGMVIQEHHLERNQVVKKRALSKKREYDVRESNNDQEMRYYRDQTEVFQERMDMAPPDEHQRVSAHSLPYIPYRIENTSPQYNNSRHHNHHMRDNMGFTHPTKNSCSNAFDHSLSSTRNRHSAPTFIPLSYPEVPTSHPSSSLQHFPPSVSVPMYPQYYEKNPDINYGSGGPMQSEMFSSLVDAKPIDQDHYQQYYNPQTELPLPTMQQRLSHVRPRNHQYYQNHLSPH